MKTGTLFLFGVLALLPSFAAASVEPGRLREIGREMRALLVPPLEAERKQDEAKRAEAARRQKMIDLTPILPGEEPLQRGLEPSLTVTAGAMKRELEKLGRLGSSLEMLRERERRYARVGDSARFEKSRKERAQALDEMRETARVVGRKGASFLTPDDRPKFARLAAELETVIRAHAAELTSKPAIVAKPPQRSAR